MPEHSYVKNEIIERLDECLNKTFGEIDTKGIFEALEHTPLQKGVAGTVIEQCVFGYDPDTRQEADLIIIEEDERTRTELKTTGMRIKTDPSPHYEAKEPMSITAVGIFNISEQEFETSHFWDKLEHMLIVYYLYDSDQAVNAYGYRLFPIKGYEFHEFSDDDIQTLKQDWQYVHDLCETIISHHPGEHNDEWQTAVMEEYLEVHGQLRRLLSYIDLAPKKRPRFRLKKTVVSSMISKHFGYELEQIPGRYITILDIDDKCRQLTERYSGKTIRQLANALGVRYSDTSANKGITEQIVVAMFGGTVKKLNEVELFNRFGLIGKTITLNVNGGRTEDMKLFHMDFSEITREYIEDDSGNIREYQFEDSDLYSYFADNEFLCILFEEPPYRIEEQSPGFFVHIPNKLGDNKFIGFKRLVFNDEFIDTKVKYLWQDTREKIMNGTLIDEVRRNRDGAPIINATGDVSSAPNFLKSRSNDVFLRGSATNSSLRNKTECVNGIRMLPQYVWIKGTTIVDELKNVELI